MRAPNQRIIVRADDMYKYYVQHGSLNLYVDPLYNKGRHKVRSAEVVAVPSGMEYWSKIVPEVQVGDLVYFHYNALTEDSALPDNPGLWVIEYERVFCSVRGGDIVMIGGRILAEPVFDDDITEVEVGGVMTKVKLSKSGLVKELHPEYNLKRARLSYIGTPLIDHDAVPIKTGDVFYYVSNGDFVNNINGKDYFVMFQEDILAIDREANAV